MMAGPVQEPECFIIYFWYLLTEISMYRRLHVHAFIIYEMRLACVTAELAFPFSPWSNMPSLG